MELRFSPPDLRRLDGLRAEAICLPLSIEDRPLRGALGLVDWRLCGRVSRLIRERRVQGGRGELLLLSPGRKLPYAKIFVYGVGALEELTRDGLEEILDDLFGRLTRVMVRASVLALPRGAMADPELAMERFLRVGQRHPEADEVTLVVDAETQRRMEMVIERERRRARAAL